MGFEVVRDVGRKLENLQANGKLPPLGSVPGTVQTETVRGSDIPIFAYLLIQTFVAHLQPAVCHIQSVFVYCFFLNSI